MAYEKPLPKIDADNREFWSDCKEHELRFQKCRNCGHIRWPSSILCPRCHSREVDRMKSEGRGRVFTFVVYHVAFHPGFKGDIPYVVAVVELEEGPFILSNIVGCRPDEVFCEMKVKAIFEDVKEDITLPKFIPEKDT